VSARGGRVIVFAEGVEHLAPEPNRGRPWRAEGCCLRLRPERPNHVWSYDFLEDRTRDGRKFRLLNVVDEFTHECLAIRVGASSTPRT
jgi:putative transposase